jgi:HEAT repeat protein
MGLFENTTLRDKIFLLRIIVPAVLLPPLLLMAWLATREPPRPPQPDQAEQHRQLLTELQAEAPEARARAAKALGEYRPIQPETVRALAKALRDRDVAVRVAAAEAIVPVAPLKMKQSLALADEVVPLLAAAVGDGDPRVRLPALALLAEIGPLAREAAPALGERLANVAGTERVSVAGALACVDAGRLPDALAVLKAALHDPEAAVRTAATQELGKIGPGAKETAADLLRTAASDKEPEARVGAAKALLQIDPAEARKAAPALADLIQDIDRRTDGKLKNAPTVSDYLRTGNKMDLQLLKHPLRNVRTEAVETLRRLEQEEPADGD